ncbi:hypothetical protein [Fibrobacter sp. UWB7]|jgi:hypothetical protein|uniref:hypothetical protein n=1 Tax=Fibrobacter sp. UWB7 TaxID=1896206 RepID=UPI000915FF5D|nr:hypothetical protein [Fibrobacter sp. UWB7]SHL95973.1 hypothetical protein SAMN05720467_0098 [Fibrobacter sp. UWB7]
MIHMNLIAVAEKNSTIGSVAQHLHVTNVADVERRYKRKYLTVAVAALFAVVAFSCYLSVMGVPAVLDGVFPDSYLNLIGAKKSSTTTTTPAGPTAEELAKQQEAVARVRAAMPVKDIVAEINPQVLFNNKRTGYGSYLPLEKLSYQKTSLPQFLSFLNTAAPDDIGFSECVYQAPNYYYLRGVAMKASSQHTLMDRLKAVSKQFQSPIASEAATEVAVFGQFSVPQVRLDAVRGFVPAAEIPAEVKALKNLAASNKVQLKGLEKPVVEDFGVFKRYAYNVSTTSDFADLLNFMNAFANSPIRMGVPKADLKYAKKFLITNLRVEMFVLR